MAALYAIEVIVNARINESNNCSHILLEYGNTDYILSTVKAIATHSL